MRSPTPEVPWILTNFLAAIPLTVWLESTVGVGVIVNSELSSVGMEIAATTVRLARGVFSSVLE